MKKVISVGLLALFVLMCFAPVHSFGTQGTPNKLSQELLDAVEALGQNEKIKAYVILYDIDSDNVMDIFRQSYPAEYNEYCKATIEDSDANYILSVDNSNEDDLNSMDDKDDTLLQQAIEIKRHIYAEEYTKKHNAFLVKNNIIDPLFISQYAPLMVLSLSKEEVYMLNYDDEVFLLDLFVDMAVEDELTLANSMTGAKDLRDTDGKKGAGVKIGQIEMGKPDKQNGDFIAYNIVCYGSNNQTEHATRVARILVGQADGIVPLAKLYSAAISDTITFYQGVEWLITQGVNIINMSAQLNVPQGNETTSPLGKYETCCKWVDHIAVQHDIHFVKSAGNRGNYSDKYITCPGMAYNAITGGGFYDLDNDNAPDDSISTFSSYQELLNGNPYAEKPNLIAAATNIYIDSNDSGTSFAAPQVAGVIAQLCGFDCYLKTRQTQVGAILAASSTCKVTGTNPGNTNGIFQSNAINAQISDVEGAGKLNAIAAKTTICNNRYWKETINTSDFPFSKNVYISSTNNSLIRVAIYWLKRNTLSSSDHTILNVSQIEFSNLNVSVYRPDGTLIDSSATIHSNFEIVQFVPTQTGLYRIEISKANVNSSNKEYVGIAVW